MYNIYKIFYLIAVC